MSRGGRFAIDIDAHALARASAFELTPSLIFVTNPSRGTHFFFDQFVRGASTPATAHDGGTGSPPSCPVPPTAGEIL